MEWWHWVVGGVALILAELAVPSFFIIWFGIGALLVAILMLIVPGLSLTAQVGLWTVASSILAALWFRVFRPGRHVPRVGSASGEVVGEVGLLVGAIVPFGRGRVRFQRPLLGADEWVCLAETEIAAGERVKVVAVEGSFLKVQKV